MTSQKDKIQALIAEIEAVLSSQANPRLPWVMSSETTQQRQVLANTREYLRSLQQVLELPGGWGPINLTTGQIAPPLASTAFASPPVTPGETAEHVLQALLVEMQHLKTNTLQPLRAEIESLRQQREALQTELRQLANQRRPPAAGDVGQQQLNRFLESLMARLQENLSAQVAGTLAKLEAGRADDLLLTPQAAATEEELTAAGLRLHPAQRLEQLRLLQAQSDQLLLKLDSTLQVVFEALQKSVNSYQESLAEGLESMHGLGHKGEGVVQALVSYLAQQLGQEASIYLTAEAAEAAISPLQPQSPPAVAPAPAHRSTKPTDSPRTSGPNIDLTGDDLDIGPDLDLTAADLDVETFDFDLDVDGTLDQPVQHSAEYLNDDGLDLLDESVIVEADSDLFSSDLPGSVAAEMDSDEAAEGEDLDALYQKLFATGADHTLANELMTDRLGLDETKETAVPEPDTAAQTGPEEPEAASEVVETDALQARFGPELTMPAALPELAAETIESLSELLPYPNQAASAATFGIGDNFESDSEFSNQLDAEPDRASAEVLEKVLALEDLTLDDLVSEVREDDVDLEDMPIAQIGMNDALAGLASSQSDLDTELGLDDEVIKSASSTAKPDRPDQIDQNETKCSETAVIETEVTFEEDRLGFEGLGTASSELVEKPSKERLEPTSASAAQASKPRLQGPLAEPRQPDSQAAWFLGLDLGSTGLSAVLMNRTDGQVHPIYWYESSDPATKRFRLPSVAWFTADHQVSAVGTVAWNEASQTQQSAEAPDSGFALRQLKPLLKVGVPHKAAVAASEEPLIQWTEQRSLPLVAVQSAMEKLLSSLVDPRQPGQTQCDAVGLAAEQLQAVLASLHGVIVGYPTNWPDTYSFNLREVLLSVRLVDRPEQIFFVEDAIAAVLSGLPDPQSGAADPGSQSHQPSLYDCHWKGGTAVISAGAVQSEIALVDLPARLNTLSHAAFQLRSFAYAGNSLDQDIICQLLHPPEANQIMAASLAEAGDAQDCCWRADLPDWTDPDWQSLGLDELTLPQPGESDIANRHRLQRRLESSPLGQSLLEAAHYLKLVLQHQPQCQLDLGNQRWLVRRRELESRIFLPYIQRINRHLNGLLSQQGLSAQAIKQVICTGGSASLAAVARWLRQKFPNATIIQDTYTGSFPNSCSRVAYGLANLVRYPQLLDIHRHQYSDYFLLTELLRSFPEQPLPFSEMKHLLEQRGVNTQVCQLHILALLGGHLPPGLIPSGADQELISRQSQELGLYQSCADAPLFEKQSGQIYVPNLEQGQRLRTYLEQILATKNQQLKEPLTAQLASTAGAASGPK